MERTGYRPGKSFIRFSLLLSFCLKQCFCSGSFLHHSQSKHCHWHGSPSPPSWLQGHVLQGQAGSPGHQQQPVHSRGPMPIWMITSYSMTPRKCVPPFSSLFLLLNLALFFLPLFTLPNMKTLCSRPDKVSTSVWSRRQAAWREERTNQVPALSHSSPGTTMTTAPIAALASSSDTWGYPMSKGHKGGSTVASVYMSE